MTDRIAMAVHPGQALLRAVVLLGSATAVLAADPVGPVPGWVEIGVALLAALAVARPDSMAGLGLLLLIGELWLTQDPESVNSPWLLLAAGGVVIAHVGLLIAAQGPASMAPDPRQLLVWAGRGAALWTGAALVWLGAGWLRGTPAPSAVVVSVLALLLASTVWTGLRLTPRDQLSRRS